METKANTLSIVIPLWNESKNIDSLIQAFVDSKAHEQGVTELILVNNGSKDETGRLIDKHARDYSWIQTIHLKENLNYGGGIQKGFEFAKSEYLGFIPGDLQVLPEDVLKIWKELQSYLLLRQGSQSVSNVRHVLFKGWRITRKDKLSIQFVSRIYTMMANFILGISVKDINALPKVFHRDLLRLLPEERINTFVFDAQILKAATINLWTIKEIPVIFHQRREGISSWSGKRIRVYYQSFKLLFKVRYLAYQNQRQLKKSSLNNG